MKQIDVRHVTRYIGTMIKTFADKRTKDLYIVGFARRFPPDVGTQPADKKTRKIENEEIIPKIKTRIGVISLSNIKNQTLGKNVLINTIINIIVIC